MKKRSMILALASMLGISAAATAVSGFAWFTTQTTATVKEHNYYVGAAQGSLKIGQVVTTDINCTSSVDEDKNEATIAPKDKALADVSSVDGQNFYKLYNLNTKAGEEAADVVKEADSTETPTDKVWMSAINANQMVCVQWELTVQNTGDATTTMDVYLSNDGDIFSDATDGLAQGKNYVDAYRLMIFDGATPVYFYAKSATGITSTDVNAGKLVKGERTGDAIFDGTGFTGDHATTAHTVTSASNIVKEGTNADAASKLNSQCLIEGLVGKAAAHTLKFVVWCEGTDTPELAVSAGNKVALNLTLAGINA